MRKKYYWIVGIIIIFFIFCLWYFIVYILYGGYACPPGWNETELVAWVSCIENLNTTLRRTPNSTEIFTYCGNRPIICD